MSYTRTEIPAAEIERQLGICRALRERFGAGETTRLALVDTYGCQQNEADSERIRGYLAEMGFGFTEDEFAADIIVVNTCAVREHAEMRVLGNVGHLNHSKKNRPGQIVAVCGCMVQQEHMARKLKMSFPVVDLVFGPHELWRMPELLQQYLDTNKRVFATAKNDGAVFEGIPAIHDRGVKAWLPIMMGCDNYCSYCVVPYVRGRERSRRAELVVADAKALIAEGYKDITLLGQNVNSYGRGLDGPDFAGLMAQVAELDGEFLIRFMSSHPKDATERLFEVMASHPRCARQLHLPVQSGSDRVLHAMNRNYTAQSYLELVGLARRYMPELVLTTDIIVGFPGETEEEFEDTLRLVDAAQFDAMFTFIYSKREGTPAARMEDPYTRQDKQQRFDRLVELSNSISLKKHRAYIGTEQTVLVDGTAAGEWPLTARTGGGRLVHMKGSDAEIGRFVPVRITDANTWALYGERA